MGGTTHGGLGPPTLIIYQENALSPMPLPPGQSYRGIFLVLVPSFHLILAYVQFTNKIKHKNQQATKKQNKNKQTKKPIKT